MKDENVIVLVELLSPHNHAFILPPSSFILSFEWGKVIN
jgi:hypothetical protein